MTQVPSVLKKCCVLYLQQNLSQKVLISSTCEHEFGHGKGISWNITPCFRCNNQLIDKLFCWAKNKRTILDVLDVLFLNFLFKQHMGSNVFLVVWRRIQIPRVWYCSIKSIDTLAPWHHHWEYKLNVWWGCRCESTAGSKEKAKILAMKHFLLQTEYNGVRIKLLPYTNFYLEVYATK